MKQAYCDKLCEETIAKLDAILELVSHLPDMKESLNHIEATLDRINMRLDNFGQKH